MATREPTDEDWAIEDADEATPPPQPRRSTLPPPRPAGAAKLPPPRGSGPAIAPPSPPRPASPTSPPPVVAAPVTPVPAASSGPVRTPLPGLPREASGPVRAAPPAPPPAPQPPPPQQPPPARPDTVDLELELDADEPEEDRGEHTQTDIQVAPREPTLDPEARAVIATCEAELETAPEPLRAARLHYEIAHAYEGAIGFSEQAATHYQRALEGAPDHVPTIRGARRALLGRGEHEAALALFDAEEKLSSSTKRKALLWYQKGRVVEDALGDRPRARDIYARALEFDPANSSVLKALEHCDRAAESPDALLQTYERAANAVAGDARHRAALLVERARLIERHGKSAGPAAAELYEAALRLDPHALGALDALERAYRRDQQWRNLSAALERDARQTTDEGHRALALYRLARVQDERLANPAEALAALAKAADAEPGDPLVLEELARSYERVENHDALATVLASLVALAGEPREQVALLHRLGQVLEGPLADADQAIVRYREALALAPTYLPVLQALGRLLASRNQWAALVEMHLAEASATRVAARAAAAHARAAEIFEVHLRQPVEAATHHARALAHVAGYPASFKALTRLYAQLERHRELVELLERAVETSAQRALQIAYLFKIGSVWEESLADPIQALHAYRRVLDRAPDDLVALHAVQRVAERAERYPQLVEALEREIALVEDRALEVGLYHRVGTVLDDLVGDHDAALIRFRKALELDPGFVPALASVGRIYYRAGRWTDLLDVYAREVKATPDGPESVALLHKMGELCEQKLGDVEAAIGWYRRAVEQDPTYRPALRALVRRLRERGDWAGLAGALELEAAGIEDPRARAITWFRVGEVYENWLDDHGKASAAYRRALEHQPGYRHARTALARLHSEHGEWTALIEALAQETDATDDDVVSMTALMRQGEIFRDELADPERAILCFETVVEHDVGAIPALLALEPLYASGQVWDKLASVYARLGTKLADPGARIAALRELARLQERRQLGRLGDRASTYDAILAIANDDEAALSALEQIGRTTRNDRILATVYSRLGEVTDSDGQAAAYLTDLAQALERLGDRRALAAYKGAVGKDAGVLTAIRGLARVGDLLGDARAMAQAARLEAELTRKPEIAAKLFVRAGILRREQMHDLGAVEDFERALEVWPDDTQGAERIIQPLLETGQVGRLVDILSNTAVSAKSPERKTALWLEVGTLYATRLDNVGAAITAFKRALDATPGHVVALSRLAGAYEKHEQWGDAVATLEQLLALTSDETARADAHLKLAAIFDERLGNIERASRSVEAVLRHDPKHAPALLRLADIQLRGGNLAEAVKTTQRLVDLATAPAQKGAALVRVARIERARGETAAADAALSEALALEGPAGDAAAELSKASELHGSWVGYAAGLANHIKRVRDASDLAAIGALGFAYLELAKTYADGMKLPARAIETLSEGLEVTRDTQLLLALSARLRESGRAEEAIAHLKHALSRDPVHAEPWRELAQAFDHAGQRDSAARARSCLAVLGVGDRGAKGTPRPASAADGSFDDTAIATIAVDAATTVPAASLLIAIADGVGKLYPASLEGYGLSTRDRIGPRSGCPLYEPAARIAKIVGAELELYEHGAAEPMVSVEPFDVPALVISQQMRRLPVPQQVFLLAYGLGSIGSRLFGALSMTMPELELALVAATKLIVPAFSLRGAQPDAVEDAKEVLRRTVMRKQRRAVELAAAEVAAKPPGDLATWQAAVSQTTIRAAALITDDLAASLEAMRHIVEMPDSRGAALVQSSGAARDLLRFWISSRATTVRTRAGMAQGH